MRYKKENLISDMRQAKLKPVTICFLTQKFVQKSIENTVMYDSEEELYIYLYMLMQWAVLKDIEKRIDFVHEFKIFIRYRRFLSVSQNNIIQIDKIGKIEMIYVSLLTEYRLLLQEHKYILTQKIFKNYISNKDDLKRLLFDILT